MQESYQCQVEVSNSTSEENSMKTDQKTKRILRFLSASEKLEIIQFAKENGNRPAAREFLVAESSVREWRKRETSLLLEAMLEKKEDSKQESEATDSEERKQ